MKRPDGLQSLKAVLFVLKREKFFYILGITFVVLLGGAISFYFLERGTNKTVESIGSAIYWAFISMTTTGYGDISPATAGGRVVAVIVVISGLLLLSLVTATIASVFVEKKIREGKGLEPVKLEDHIVLCGWNSNAEDVIAELLRSLPEKKIRLVLVNELAEDKIEALKYKYRRSRIQISSRRLRTRRGPGEGEHHQGPLGHHPGRHLRTAFLGKSR